MTTEEKIAELETNCKAMTAEIEKLKAELAEKNETVWIPQKGEKYLCICNNGRIASQIYNPSSIFDIEIIDMNAKFKPVAGCKKHLEWYRDNVLRVQNKLMQLHELLCPDCFPDWDTGKKYGLYIMIIHISVLVILFSVLVIGLPFVLPEKRLKRLVKF